MLRERCFGALSCQFWSTVLQCGGRLPIHTLNYWTVKSVVPVFNWGCVCVWHCTLLICGSIMYAVQDRVFPDAPFSLCSTWVICASVGYTRRFGCTSVHLCPSVLQNLEVPQDFCSPVSISVEWSWWPCIRWCGTGLFQEQGQCLLIGLVNRTIFLQLFSHFLSFYGLVLWGWGLWADMVFIALSQSCIGSLF